MLLSADTTDDDTMHIKRFFRQHRNIVSFLYTAQLDARPTGDQEVAGSIPPGGNILLWRFYHGIFSTVILSFPLIQEGQLSVSCERNCTILVNRLEDYSSSIGEYLIVGLFFHKYCLLKSNYLFPTFRYKI